MESKTIVNTTRSEASEMLKGTGISEGMKGKEIHDRLTKCSSTPLFKREVRCLRLTSEKMLGLVCTEAREPKN